MENEKQIFKVGDKVFDIRCGWGEVIKYEIDLSYPVQVRTKNGGVEGYTHDGKVYSSDLNTVLSFKEYTLQGFSQERPIEFEDGE